MEKKSILFVCLGNTCRSPLAEAIFRKLIRDTGQVDSWIVDSAGISDWHVGKTANPRSIEIMEQHDLLPYDGVSRQITRNDFLEFKFIIGMDCWNVEDLEILAGDTPGSRAEIYQLRDFDPMGGRNIPDPYFENNKEVFEMVYEMCDRSVREMLRRLSNK